MPNGAIDTGVAIFLVMGCLAVLLALPSLIDVFPSLISCILRSHESENLSSSVSLTRCRNVVCMAFLIPTLIVISQAGIYPPAGATDKPMMKILIVVRVLVPYVLLRLLLRTLTRRGKTCNSLDDRRWKCVTHVPLTFFAIGELLVCASCGIASLCACRPDDIGNLLLWECACVYAVCVLRKTQIFAQYCGLFSSFLYLCTLELIPTGLLICSAIYV